MSVRMMALVWEADLPRDQKFILLAYADHANDDGYNVFPSVPRIAWKTGYSERQVQRITSNLVKVGILVQMGNSQLGTNLLRINVKRMPMRGKYISQRRGRPPSINGDKMSPIYLDDDDIQNENGDISDIIGDIPDENGDIFEINGDTVMSPEPSLESSEEPSTNHHFGRSAPDQLEEAQEHEESQEFLNALILEGIASFPEDVRPWGREFYQSFSKVPPAKSLSDPQCEYLQHIDCFRRMAGALGKEFGPEILRKVRSEWEEIPPDYRPEITGPDLIMQQTFRLAANLKSKKELERSQKEFEEFTNRTERESGRRPTTQEISAFIAERKANRESTHQ